jgi:hypothetical protein
MEDYHNECLKIVENLNKNCKGVWSVEFNEEGLFPVVFNLVGVENGVRFGLRCDVSKFDLNYKPNGYFSIWNLERKIRDRVFFRFPGGKWITTKGECAEC